MDRARIHEGIRRMRFTDVLGRSERLELSQMEAAELLGISERTFRRWRDRHRDDGLEGLDDRRLAPSPRRAPVAEIERMLGLYRELYRGFTVKHFHEQLGKRHNYTLGYTVTKLHLHRSGLVRAATKRSAHRKKRATVLVTPSPVVSHTPPSPVVMPPVTSRPLTNEQPKSDHSLPG